MKSPAGCSPDLTLRILSSMCAIMIYVNITVLITSAAPQVNVNLVGILAKIAAGEYEPTLNDQVLCASRSISTEWPEQPHDGHLHIFVRVPGAGGSPTLLQGEFSMCLFALARDI
jgi:hypothetical protein